MTDISAEILAVLRTQETALLAMLETVRQAIEKIQPGGTGQPSQLQIPQSTNEEGRFMNLVLAGLGMQFTTAEIFEQAKKLKPGFKRDSVKRAITRLQMSGVIKKIEEGRGRHPARFERRFFH
jgi:hypothetical protein